MNTEEKTPNDRASAGNVSGEQEPEMEEVLDLVDEISPVDDSSQPEQARDMAPETDEEQVIDLTDIVEEGPSEIQLGEIALEGEAEEILEPKGEQATEKEEPIELGDKMVPELDITLPEPEEDSLIDVLGMEIFEEGAETTAETPADEEPAYEELAVPEEVAEVLVDTGEAQPEAEVQLQLESEELGVEQEVEPVLEKLSDEKLEEIVTGIVKKAVDEKVERILLEAAEAAIAGEIDRLKQAL